MKDAEIRFANVLPRQLTSIPWGWENKTISGGEWQQATFVSKPLGRIEMPNLVAHFDWMSFVVEGRGVPLGTRNMKSIFTTAARFLGYEELLTKQPDLSEITHHFLVWNKKLLEAWSGHLLYFMLGDDIAGNNGLFVDPKRWRKWIYGEQARLLALAKQYGLETIYHSDGDISAILPDLLASPLVDVINYEPVGGMEAFRDREELCGKRLELVHDQGQTHTESMRLQRSTS